MFITFSSIAVNTRLSENSHQAVRFHSQIFDQLERLRGQSDLLQRSPSTATESLIVRYEARPTCQMVSNFVPSGMEYFPDLSWMIW